MPLPTDKPLQAQHPIQHATRSALLGFAARQLTRFLQHSRTGPILNHKAFNGKIIDVTAHSRAVTPSPQLSAAIS
ncbi:MAG: hypothetical protein ACP5EP_02395 [Acidobacteriaceae bacterium]